MTEAEPEGSKDSGSHELQRPYLKEAKTQKEIVKGIDNSNGY